MTARGRMEAWVVSFAPFGLGVGLTILQPATLRRFFAHPIGIPFCRGGAIWMRIGFFVIREILTPDFL